MAPSWAPQWLLPYLSSSSPCPYGSSQRPPSPPPSRSPHHCPRSRRERAGALKIATWHARAPGRPHEAHAAAREQRRAHHQQRQDEGEDEHGRPHVGVESHGDGRIMSGVARVSGADGEWWHPIVQPLAEAEVNHHELQHPMHCAVLESCPTLCEWPQAALCGAAPPRRALSPQTPAPRPTRVPAFADLHQVPGKKITKSARVKDKFMQISTPGCRVHLDERCRPVRTNTPPHSGEVKVPLYGRHILMHILVHSLPP